MNLYGKKITYTSSKTRKILNNSPMRCFNDSVQIKINNKWLDVARMDLLDEIGTTICGYKPKDYKQLAEDCFGSKITDNTFFIIDSLTDG